jgi:cysteine desulfurase
VTPEQVDAAITASTVLVSVMHVNNEIGVIEDIPEIARVCHSRGVLLHVDAAQSAGKIPLDLTGWGVDLCSLTAHKINGPKGIGALYVRSGIALAPLVDGGEPEIGLRGGTLATHQIVGMGKAFELADPDVEGARLAKLRDELWRGLEALGGVTRNGNPERSAPHILSASLRGVDGASLLFALPDIALSQGSACNSSVPEPSYVLTALGLSDAVAQSTLRFGLGRFTERADVTYVLERVTEEFNRLRALARGAPAWCSS